MSQATDLRQGGQRERGNPASGKPVQPGAGSPSPVLPPDPARWPDVAARPRGPVAAAVARMLLRKIADRMPLQVSVPSGRVFGGGQPGTPVLRLIRPGDFYRRVGAGGLIGFGESFMAGDWDCDDLAGLLTIMAREMDSLVPPRLQWLRDAYVRHHPAGDDADETGARRNIQRHYDLSNDLFALFLDETMTYSAGIFDTGAGGTPVPVAATGMSGAPDSAAGDFPAGDFPAGDSPAGAAGNPGGAAGAGTAAAAQLAEAQRRKIDRLLDRTGVGAGSRVLEIGTGWGELAIRAAARGAQVLSLTLSSEQRDLAVARIRAAGLSGQARVELMDYRQASGQYDAILSVEMIEAVAERYWPDYFAALGRLLAPGGRIGLQAITMPHHRMLATRRTYTWILKYIFPGGLIPSVTAIEQNAARNGLRVTDRRDFGAHYAQTLAVWRERYCAERPAVLRLGFDETFFRMWLMYLCYSEAGFRSGYLDVSQFVLESGLAA